MPKTAIYPGSFDPVTYGHVDIVQRGRKLFDKIIVAILHNPAKKSLFTIGEDEMVEDLDIKIPLSRGILVMSIRGCFHITQGAAQTGRNQHIEPVEMCVNCKTRMLQQVQHALSRKFS